MHTLHVTRTAMCKSPYVQAAFHITHVLGSVWPYCKARYRPCAVAALIGTHPYRIVLGSSQRTRHATQLLYKKRSWIGAESVSETRHANVLNPTRLRVCPCFCVSPMSCTECAFTRLCVSRLLRKPHTTLSPLVCSIGFEYEVFPAAAAFGCSKFQPFDRLKQSSFPFPQAPRHRDRKRSWLGAESAYETRHANVLNPAQLRVCQRTYPRPRNDKDSLLIAINLT